MFRSGWRLYGYALSLGWIVVIGPAGCINKPAIQTTRYSSSPCLIFNPEGSNIPDTSFSRSDWPATANTLGVREEISYRERFIDFQGRGQGHGGDSVYRRFESARTGQSRR